MEGRLPAGAGEDRDAFRERVARQVSPGEETQLAARDEDDVRAVLAESFGPLGAVHEEGQHLPVRHLAGER